MTGAGAGLAALAAFRLTDFRLGVAAVPCVAGAFICGAILRVAAEGWAPLIAGAASISAIAAAGSDLRMRR